jgi:hypothetical protein
MARGPARACTTGRGRWAAHGPPPRHVEPTTPAGEGPPTRSSSPAHHPPRTRYAARLLCRLSLVCWPALAAAGAGL